jgi:hypothetical protein
MCAIFLRCARGRGDGHFVNIINEMVAMCDSPLVRLTALRFARPKSGENGWTNSLPIV